MELPTPPAAYGYTEPPEALAYYQGHVMGQHAAEVILGSILAQEHYEATHDKQTGLLNYAGLTEVIRSMGTDMKNKGVLYLDATNFKAVNDLISHDRGDDMLLEISAALNRVRRAGDFAARIGGDEFMLILSSQSQHLPPTQERRRIDATLAENVAGTRMRFEQEVAGILSRNPDVAELGFQIAIGATLGTVGYNIHSLKAAAEAEMRLHKAQQHQDLGQYRTA